MTGETGIEQRLRDTLADESAVAALSIVSDELMETIRSAHLALEDCVDGRGGSAALVRAAELLHQVRGVLQMTETFGAALLAEEMELGCTYLAALSPGKGREDGLDALTRAMVQLPSYIERLLGGARDIALVLLPILNDLRAVRGQPLLSEGTLLLLNLSPSRRRETRAVRPGSGEDPSAVAARLRPRFQLALLGWIKGGDAKRHLESLARVAENLELASTREDMYQLWWVLGGVLESLEQGGLQPSVAMKRLLGQADRQMKHIIDIGTGAFDAYPVDDLLNNLLYYVARSSTDGERIRAIRDEFELTELLPGDAQVELAREAMSGPSLRLMETVARAIKEDLARVKDVLDIYVRTGMHRSAELLPQLELLKKISDTLGVLGLGELRGDIEGEIDRLKGLVEQGGVADESTILEIAAALLRVEDQLDRQLMRLIAPRAEAQDETDDLPPAEASDYQRVTESVIRECIINLARVKETVSQSLAAGAPSQGLDSVPSLIQGIKAGLLMLNKTRAMNVVDRVGKLITLALSGNSTAGLTPQETDRLADAIVSVEYYMETVKAGRSEPSYMLDNADACLRVLRETAERIEGERAAQAETVEDQAEEAVAATETVAVPVEQTALPTQAFAVIAQDAEHLDPELLELFIEEAKEECRSINRNLPSWAEVPDDMETLITIRRSFHTLKGSGRMVGAERIAEYCWRIENLLNKLINQTLVRTPPMIDFIVTAAAGVAELIEQIEVGTEPRSAIDVLIARAVAFAEEDPHAAVLELEPGAAAGEDERSPALEMDPVLLDIFSKETAGHVQVIRDYVEACESEDPPFEVTDKLYRACHTLHGSANMANVERGMAVAGALNRWVRRVHEQTEGFQSYALDLLSRAADAILEIIDDVNKPDRERADFAGLIGQLNALGDAIEPDAATAEPQPVALAEVPAPDAKAATADVEDTEYDAEIAAIFTEESAELLEMADKALGDWSRDKTASQPMDELKRHLHTLKGGARMAGIMAMGNLSHDLETLLTSIGEGRVSLSPALDGLLQQSIDELHNMRDALIAGKPVRQVSELSRRIRQANAGLVYADETAAAPRTDEVEEHPEVAAFSSSPGETVSMVIVDTQTPAVPEEADAEAAEGVEAESDISPEWPAQAEPELEPEARSEAIAEAGAEQAAPAERRAEMRQEFARIDAGLLEDLLNAAGEISIYHSRLSQQVNAFEFHVVELEQTIARLREQLRKLEIETEAQIIHSHQATLKEKDFDPLELDRYSMIQQLSRALAESASDLTSLKDLLQSVTGEAENLLVQQSRVTAELQDGLMRARMVPFEQHVPRLTRLVRHIASEAGKRAELAVEGAAGELDRQVLEKMLPPFEHMLRNAVVHGIEMPESRQRAGKPAAGRITIRLHREGSEMVIDVADDGRGLDIDAIRRKAFELDMLRPDAKVSDEEIMELILTPGFSTAGEVTQAAGRGVGMDVVANEIKKLGGSLRIASIPTQGTNFTVRLPFTLAITQALIVRTGEEVYALPMPSVEGIARIPRRELEYLLSQPEASYEYGEQSYQFQHLGLYLDGGRTELSPDEAFIPVILVRAGERSVALLTDEMLASREIVVKSVGPQIASIEGISGATILGDGKIVLILDIPALIRKGAPVVEIQRPPQPTADERPVALVVDDSITVRRVTERFLKRNGMRVLTARDGLDAISVLRENRPDIIVLDIEMPRMDGYEFASHVRNDEQFADVPIIMVTSRVGDKHRARAIELGVNDYLGKPYRDDELLAAIERLLEERGLSLA